MTPQTPERPFMLQQMAAPRRSKRAWIAALIAVVAFAVGGSTVYALTRPEPRSIDGVEAPNKLCRDNIEDLSHPWIKNGWWVGYVDGEVKGMVSSDAQALSMAGYEMSGIWLCPPKSEW